MGRRNPDAGTKVHVCFAFFRQPWRKASIDQHCFFIVYVPNLSSVWNEP